MSASQIIDDDLSTLSSEDSNSGESHEDSNSEMSFVSKITQNPQFYVLAQFLESPTSNKNITTILEELVEEIRLLRKSLTTSK
jgi:hypothetical protein